MARVVAAWALVGVLGGSAFADATHRADQIDRAREQVLDESYQKQFPGEGSAMPLPGGGLPASRDPHDRLDHRDRRFSDGEGPQQRDHAEGPDLNAGPLASVFSALMWGLLIVGIGILVFWLGSELVKYGGDDAELAGEPRADDGIVDLAVIQRPLGDAEELATRGEFREAIHTLLLRTLQELVRSSAVRVGPSLTSREILGRVPLSPDARDALRGLIIAVELTHFGSDDATLEDYAGCRAQFQKFATAFSARGIAA